MICDVIPVKPDSYIGSVSLKKVGFTAVSGTSDYSAVTNFNSVMDKAIASGRGMLLFCVTGYKSNIYSGIYWQVLCVASGMMKMDYAKNESSIIYWLTLADSVGTGLSTVTGNFVGSWITKDYINGTGWNFTTRISTEEYNSLTSESEIVLDVFAI